MLELGGRRIVTPFMQMHDAARMVVQSIIAEGAGTSRQDLEARIGAAFTATGLATHGQVDDYRLLASAMLRYFLATRSGHTPEPPQAISLTVGGEEVVVTPDDILVRPDGRRIIRRVRTGHGRKSHLDDTAARALAMAAAQAYPGAVVDLVYLADEDSGAAVVELSARKLASGRLALSRDPRQHPGRQVSCRAVREDMPGLSGVLRMRPDTPAGNLQRNFRGGLPVG